jgi:hypothetical protein
VRIFVVLARLNNMNSSTTGRFAVSHSPLRATIAIVVLLIVAGDALQNFFYFHGSRPHWFSLMMSGVFFSVFGYGAARLFFQLVRRMPILQTSPDGVSLHLYSGKMFIPWQAIEAITDAPGKWIRIRLRPGTRPEASIFARLASASLWQRRTVAVLLATAAPSAESIVENLRHAQARFMAAGEQS